MKSKRYQIILANGEFQTLEAERHVCSGDAGARVISLFNGNTFRAEFCAILGFSVVDLIKRHELPKL